jgi:hypothetical protein
MPPLVAIGFISQELEGHMRRVYLLSVTHKEGGWLRETVCDREAAEEWRWIFYFFPLLVIYITKLRRDIFLERKVCKDILYYGSLF